MKKQLALITGGTSGIGLGIATSLASEYDLAICYAKNKEKAASAVEHLRKLSSGEVRAYQQEMISYEDCTSLIDAVRRDFDLSPSVLVNNAGRIRDGLFLGTDFDRHNTMIQEHLTIAMGLTHLLIKDMYRNKFGRIINISSITAQYVKKGQVSYTVAKAGVEALTKSLALEVAHRGITVNAIAPGIIETEMTKDIIDKIKSAKVVNLKKWIPVGHYGVPEDIGRVARFLCMKESHYITGQVFKIDGGRSLGETG